ncbi:DUF502 domain-containing protein [Natronorarus salvus]|uniref:DUF502 domain-containing protein n=1 Tax=Natronorarus salvus TaxID=3117733 RepID=UPI002F260D9D
MARSTSSGPISRLSADAFLAGVAVIVPLIVTLYILWIGLQFLGRALTPLASLLVWAGFEGLIDSLPIVGLLVELGIYGSAIAAITEFVAFVVLIGVILLVGSMAKHRAGERAIQVFDYAIARIPGVGTLYTSFRRVGDMMASDTIEEFEGVKLVEFSPTVHVLGFETNAAPPAVTDAMATDDVIAIFIPFAPNPVTGGFLTYMPRDRVTDLDMTVEDAVRNVITSGIAGEEASEKSLGVGPASSAVHGSPSSGAHAPGPFGPLGGQPFVASGESGSEANRRRI